VFLVLLLYMLRLRSRHNTALTERNNTLSEMNTAKDKFFNIISHDLRNPAVALHEALKILAKNGLHWNSDTLTAYYDDLLCSSESHVELIHHLLNWAKAQTGRFTYTPETCFLAPQLQFTLSQVRNIAAKKGVTLIDDIPDDALVAADANILAISAENTAETVNAMLEAGADGFISKQQSGDNELAEAIRSVMNGLDYFGRDIAHIIYGVVKAKSLTQKDAPNFSERELDVIRLCSEGLLSKQIADRLGISPNTVTTYKERIFAKLDINSTLELVNYAMKKKIIYS